MVKARKTPKGSDDPEIRLKVRVRQFAIPPVRDALVIGRQSPVGCVAMKRCIGLLSPDPFEDIHIPDHPIVSDLIVRRHLLLRAPKEQLTDFVLREIAPMMGDTEILVLDLDVEVELEAAL